MKDFLRWQKQLKDGVRDNVETMLPAEVFSYNHQTKLAEVRVLVSLVNSSDNSINIPILKDISVSYPCFNGFEISYPLKKGDIGRICVFSKDLDTYKKTGGLQTQPNESRFNYHNAIFIPDLQVSSSSNISSADNLVIGRSDGGLVVELTPQNEAIIKQNNVAIIKINTDSTISCITPSFNIQGILNVTGVINATGDITSESNVVDLVGSMQEMRTIYNAHTHAGDSGGITSTPL